MERLWKVACGVLVALAVGAVMAIAPGAAIADDSQQLAVGSGGGAHATPDYLRGNSQGDGNGQ